MTLEIDQLKSYIKDTLGADISRLTLMVNEFNSSLRHIEITTSANTAKLETTMEQHTRQIISLETTVRSVQESQKFKWKEHDDKEDKDKEEKSKADIEMAKVLSSFSTIVKLLWFVSALVIAMIIGLLWNIFINGGIKNLP